MIIDWQEYYKQNPDSNHRHLTTLRFFEEESVENLKASPYAEVRTIKGWISVALYHDHLQIVDKLLELAGFQAGTRKENLAMLYLLKDSKWERE